MSKFQPAPGDCNCLAIRKAARRVSSFYDAELAPTGLRTTQFAILSIVARNGEMTVNSLAERMDLDRTTAGRNLRPLEKAKLIRIAASAEDRRVRAITLTPAGQEALKQLMPLWRKAQAKFEVLNGKEKSASLRGALNDLRLAG